jgi:hypothetical protein
MRLDGVTTVGIGESLNGCDAFLFASGYERRARSILAVASGLPGFKLCLGFEEHQGVLSRAENDKAYADAGVPIRLISGESRTAARQAVRDTLEHVPDNGTLAVDITSMTRVWHAAMISEVLGTEGRTRLRTVFIYVPAVFTPPADDFSRTKHVFPLEGFTGFGLPDLPTALVVGLGYEPERALGLHSLLDPSLTAVFLASPADSRYYQAVLETNDDLLRRLPDELRFEYPLHDPAATMQLIESLCSKLSSDYRVILASLGPKLFGVECMLVTALRPELSVWRVSSGSGAPRDAEGDMEYASACSVNWVNRT